MMTERASFAPGAYNALGDCYESVRDEHRDCGADELSLHHPLKGGFYLPEHFFEGAEQVHDQHIGFSGALR